MFVVDDAVFQGILNGGWFYSFADTVCYFQIVALGLGFFLLFFPSFCYIFCYLKILYSIIWDFWKKIVSFLPGKVLSLWQDPMNSKLRESQSRRANNTGDVLSSSKLLRKYSKKLSK